MSSSQLASARLLKQMLTMRTLPTVGSLHYTEPFCVQNVAVVKQGTTVPFKAIDKETFTTHGKMTLVSEVMPMRTLISCAISMVEKEKRVNFPCCTFLCMS